MEDDDLRATVEAQANARVSGDLAAYASHMTPQALLRLHRTGTGRERRSRSFDVLLVEAKGDSGVSEVRYAGSGSYVVRTRWERRDGHWKAIMVEIPRALVRAPLWKRLLGAGGTSSDHRDAR